MKLNQIRATFSASLASILIFKILLSVEILSKKNKQN